MESLCYEFPCHKGANMRPLNESCNCMQEIDLILLAQVQCFLLNEMLCLVAAHSVLQIILTSP